MTDIMVAGVLGAALLVEYALLEMRDRRMKLKRTGQVHYRMKAQRQKLPPKDRWGDLDARIWTGGHD